MKKENSKFQVIIAHPILEERQRIATLFEQSGMFSVCYMTHDGLDCLREVVARQPDLVIAHAVLDKIDGLELFRRLNEFSLPQTKRLYITNYSNFLADYAVLVGVDYCILMPCPDEVLVRRAGELVLPPQVAASDEKIDANTVRILRLLSAPESKKGYYYAIDGVRILVRDPKLVMRRKVTTELYGGIAQIHGLKNSLQVERCLRTLTNRVFLVNSANTLAQYFPATSVQSSRITNTTFLTSIAHLVVDALAEENKASITQNGQV